MESAVLEKTRQAVLCREITSADREKIVNLLTKGFIVWRRRAFWVTAIDRLEQRTPPAGLPRFGYLLEANGTIVGVLLVLASQVGGVLRCNVSSWYVEPDYRPFGTLLVHRALRQRNAVIMNVTPAPETWDVLAAQGYHAYVNGRAVLAPALARVGAGARIHRVRHHIAPHLDVPDEEAALLRHHAAWNNLSLIAERNGQIAPFVFGRRSKFGLRFAYLLYCRSLDSLADYARSLGLYLLRHGIAVAVTDADARLRAMPGRYLPNFPKFYRGPVAPRAGDLAYTERAIFGT